MLTHLNLPAELDGRVWRYANQAAANRRHHHAELELNLVTAGQGIYLLGNRRYAIHRGDLLWLFPAQEHVLIEQSADFAMWVAVFRRRAVRRYAIDSSTRPLLQRQYAGDTCRRLKGTDLARFEDLFDELATEGETGLMNAGLSYALLHAWKCFQRATDVPVRELHPAVERAARLLDSEDSLSLEELAQRAGLSPSRLSRLFKQQTGANLVDFRNRLRVERFQQIYGNESRSTLLEAALDAGFGSYPQFHRVLRDILGCSPKTYAARVKI
jgi:AraC-like DNA-binding protein